MRKVEESFCNILVSPKTGERLVYNEEKAMFQSEDKLESYKVLDHSANLLPIGEKAKHVDHYMKDAQHFSYFEQVSFAWRMESNRLHEEILKAIGPLENKVLMDVGSGGGWLVSSVLNNARAKIISFDISEDNINKLQHDYASENHFGIIGDAMNMPVKASSIDYVVASEVIEHVPDPRKFVANLYQTVKPGGKLVISTPYDEKIVYSLCVHCNKPTPHDAHLHSFDENKLMELVQGLKCHVNFKLLNHWWLLKTKMHMVLSILPHPVWRIIDKLFISISKKPSRIIMELVKPFSD